MLATVTANHLVDLQLWAIGGGIIVPLLVSLLTKLNAPNQVKSLLNLGLTAVAGAIATVIQGGGVVSDWKAWLIGIGDAWVISIGTYYGLWKPSGTAPALSLATANFGLGKRIHAAVHDLVASPPTESPLVAVDVPPDPTAVNQGPEMDRGQNSALDPMSGPNPPVPQKAARPLHKAVKKAAPVVHPTKRVHRDPTEP